MRSAPTERVRPLGARSGISEISQSTGNVIASPLITDQTTTRNGIRGMRQESRPRGEEFVHVHATLGTARPENLHRTAFHPASVPSVPVAPSASPHSAPLAVPRRQLHTGISRGTPVLLRLRPTGSGFPLFRRT